MEKLHYMTKYLEFTGIDKIQYITKFTESHKIKYIYHTELHFFLPLSGHVKYSVDPEYLSAEHFELTKALNVIGDPEHALFELAYEL